MPNELNKNKEDAGGDDAAAKAAADKAAADAAATAAAVAKAAADGEETITMKKSDLKKIEEDRDNYKEGLLRKKADERSLDDKGKGGGEGGATIDEAKVTEIAKAQATAAFAETHTSNEKRAKILITKKYGELVDDANWVGFMSNFTGKRGRATIEDILDDFEDAMLLYKRSTGKLEEHLKAEHERGVREGRIQGELGSGRDTGGAGDKNDGGKSSGAFSSPKGEEMARGMHVDPEKAKKVDPSKDNVINVT